MLQILCSTKCTIKIFLKHLFNIKKMTSNQDTLRKRVYAFHEQHFDKPDSFTVNHFKVEGIPRSTLYSILQRKADGISAERQSGSGKQNAKILIKVGIKELVCLFDQNAEHFIISSGFSKANEKPLE